MKEEYGLLNIVRGKVAERRLSRKTENAYLNHIRKFLDFHAAGDDAKTERQLIGDFLKHLALAEHAAEATQNQALSALSFLYREVFGRKLPSACTVVKRPRPIDKTPIVFTSDEAKAVLSNLSGTTFLAAALMYGSGLRISEVVALRVGDIDFARREIIIRNGKTVVKDRTTILPESIAAELQRHLKEVRYIFEDDCLLGFGKVFLPLRIARKFPHTDGDWRWQFVFPACKLAKDEAFGTFRRYHIGESTLQKAIGEAIRKAIIGKKACCQTLRYSFAVRLAERKHTVQTVQNLLGHRHLKTTLCYFHRADRAISLVCSPLDY